jgi:glucose-1-phosphatase
LVPSSVTTLLFDLGGVIINIDPIRVAESFAQLTGRDLTRVRNAVEVQHIFAHFEGGRWDTDQFRKAIREILETDLSDAQILQAWNSMLLDIPAERITLLQQLRKKYRLLLLSNTNPLHIETVNQILRETAGIDSLEALFDKTYYSYAIQLMKPAVEIYEYVLRDSNISAGETVFIDDNLANIEGAARAGIHTIHVQAPATILDYFANVSP